MNWKKILLRALIIAVIATLIACVGGMGVLDLTFFIIVGLLVAILAVLVVILHRLNDKE